MDTTTRTAIARLGRWRHLSDAAKTVTAEQIVQAFSREGVSSEDIAHLARGLVSSGEV